MANDCIGTMRVVAKSKDTLKRIRKIMNYEDDEFFVSRCRQCDPCEEPENDGGLWIQDFAVDGCWNCERFFDTPEDRKTLIVKDYEKSEDGSDDFRRPIYGTAHLTNLVKLAVRLDFGCELFSTEPGCAFCEHISVTHDGEFCNDTGEYFETYPIGDDGETDYNAEPTEHIGLDDFMSFMSPGDIYGE